MNGLRIGSLFSGIGGLELGLERAGVGRVVFQCEINPWARAILAKHWPDVPCHDDINTFEPEEGSADLVCLGFPCQDVSKAGSQEGLEGKRSGLWFKGLRVVRKIRPRYVVVENVQRLLELGFGTVLAGLAACGYDAEWHCIPAAAVGAPHLRDRVFILAYANGGGHLHREAGKLPAEGRFPPLAVSGSRRRPVPHADGQRQLQPEGGLGLVGRRAGDRDWWLPEPRVGRVAYGVPDGVDRLAGLGNAVVPQVAEWVGGRIRMIEEDRRFGYDAACTVCGEKTTCYLASPEWACSRCGGRVMAFASEAGVDR